MTQKATEAGPQLSWKEDKTRIKLPKEAKGQANYVIASCNGVVYKIQRGVEVEVPKAIAEILEHAEAAREEADAYAETVEQV